MQKNLVLLICKQCYLVHDPPEDRLSDSGEHGRFGMMKNSRKELSDFL